MPNQISQYLKVLLEKEGVGAKELMKITSKKKVLFQHGLENMEM